MKKCTKTELPAALQNWVDRIGTRKRNFYLHEIRDRYTRRASAWDGGSKTSYDLFKVTECGRGLVPIDWPAGTAPGGFSEGFKPGPEFELPARAVIIESGTFRGKPSAPCFKVTESARAAMDGIPSEAETKAAVDRLARAMDAGGYSGGLVESFAAMLADMRAISPKQYRAALEAL